MLEVRGVHGDRGCQRSGAPSPRGRTGVAKGDTLPRLAFNFRGVVAATYRPGGSIPLR